MDRDRDARLGRRNAHHGSPTPAAATTPRPDTWTATSTGANVPSPRQRSFVRLDRDRDDRLGRTGPRRSTSSTTAARYNPANNYVDPDVRGRERARPRASHSAVWSGSEMIVWGGADGAVLDTGDGTTRRPIAGRRRRRDANVPAAAHEAHRRLDRHGDDRVGRRRRRGARTRAAATTLPTNSWSPTSTGANLPTARQTHTAVWTGDEMIVWGGVRAAIGRLRHGRTLQPVCPIAGRRHLDGRERAPRARRTQRRLDRDGDDRLGRKTRNVEQGRACTAHVPTGSASSIATSTETVTATRRSTRSARSQPGGYRGVG